MPLIKSRLVVLDHNSYLRQPVLPFRESSWYCMLGSWIEEGPCEILRISNRDVEKTVWLVTGEGELHFLYCVDLC